MRDGQVELIVLTKEELEARREGMYNLLDLAYALDDGDRGPCEFGHMIEWLFPSCVNRKWLKEWATQKNRERADA